MIDLEITERVAFITVNAPATRNALNSELAGQFVAACDEADRDPQVGAAVIRGAGGTFCSGAERGHLDEVGRDPVEENRSRGPRWHLPGLHPGRPAGDADHSRGPRRRGRGRDQPDARHRPAHRRRGCPADQRLPADRAAPGRRPLRAAGRARGRRGRRRGRDLRRGDFRPAGPYSSAWPGRPCRRSGARSGPPSSPAGWPATRNWPGKPRRACVPSSGRPGCRGPPRARSSGARSSGRCAAGSRNS